MSTDMTSERFGSRSALSRLGTGLFNAMLRRAEVQSLNIDSMEADSFSIDEIQIGNSTVESVQITNIQTQVNTGRAFLRNVRTITTLRVDVGWEIDLWFWGRSGTIPVRTIPIPFPLGDVEIPELDNLDISVPSAEVNESVIAIQPIDNLVFNGGTVSDISVSQVQAPVDGYGIAGLSFDNASLSHIGIPDAAVASVSIGSVEPNSNVTLPSIETGAISVADVQVPTVQSNRPISINNAGAQGDPINLINLGFLKVSITLRPSMDMNIESLVLDDMEATSTIEAVQMQNVQFPMKINGIEINGVSATQLRAEQVSL
ncbi:MAG: hypothetical protein KTR32_39360 [Granulosicoccus sp.]|nr:hypothetical protein [Granulosicoccus sp.]